MEGNGKGFELLWEIVMCLEMDMRGGWIINN